MVRVPPISNNHLFVQINSELRKVRKIISSFNKVQNSNDTHKRNPRNFNKF